MIKPPMSNIPGMNAMNDTLGFVKNLWGGMGVPGMVMPTLSVDDINKQISDLKAVESWLNLNMNMLRGTIQALEVQAATISTLQTMGETLAAAAKAGSAVKPKPAVAKPAPEAPPPKAEPGPAAAAETKPEAQPNPFAGKFVAPQANPAAWWNMLQDQFKQAVNSAMSTDAGKAGGKGAPNGSKSKPAAAAAKRTSNSRKPAAPKGNSKNAS